MQYICVYIILPCSLFSSRISHTFCQPFLKKKKKKIVDLSCKPLWEKLNPAAAAFTDKYFNLSDPTHHITDYINWVIIFN